MANSARFAPMPSASVSTATAVKPGFFSSWRMANLKSFIFSFFDYWSLAPVRTDRRGSTVRFRVELQIHKPAPSDVWNIRAVSQLLIPEALHLPFQQIVHMG